jgi:cytochrome P450
MSTVARPDGAGAPSGGAPGLSGKAPVLPDGPSTPRLVQGVMAFAAPLWTLRRLHERYGSAFTIDIPVLGKVVIISDPAEVKQLFTTSPEIADTATTLAWAVERLRRHPAVLRRLADEVDAGPDTYQWIPFGGGARRCLGAAFAHREMNVVLRTLLRDFTLEPTTERGECWHSRGIAFCPARGGRAVVCRRTQ